MKRPTLMLMAMLAFSATSAHALEVSDFHVGTTAHLVTLCSASANHPMHDAAIGAAAAVGGWLYDKHKKKEGSPGY